MRDLHPVIEQGEQIVGDDSLQRFPVVVAKAHPQTVELWAAKKGLTFRLEIVGELANEVNRADFPQRNFNVLAYRIPNLFRRLVAEGSMTASFIPVFSSYMREKSKEEVWEFANRLFWTLALVAAVITVLGMVFSPSVVRLFAGKNIAGVQAVELNRIIFPYLFFVSLAALAMGILNCFHVFGLPAATPVFLNLATIFFTFAIVRNYFKDAATSIAVGVLVGGVLQFLIQVPLLVRKGMNFNFGISFSHPAIRDVARLMIPRLFGIGIGQINLLINALDGSRASLLLDWLAGPGIGQTDCPGVLLHA